LGLSRSTHPVAADNMWADDAYWYPLFLEEAAYFKGDFYFTNTTTLLRHTLTQLTPTEVAQMHAVPGLNQ
jgi:hypothetical protein